MEAGVLNSSNNRNCQAAEELHNACYYGYLESVKDLGRRLGHLDLEDKIGNKPLHWAAQGNQPEVVKFLLEQGSNINDINKSHHTALHYAVKGGFVDCVRELAMHPQKLDVNIKDDEGNTALHVAIEKMNSDIVNKLIEIPQVDFSITNKDGLNSLHLAALKGNTVVVEKMSENKDIVDLQEENEGYTALHFAAVNGHYCVVERLLTQASCSINIPNKGKETPLFLAAREGYCDVVELLQLAGANINAKDKNGNTALHISLIKQTEDQPKHEVLPTSEEMKAIMIFARQVQKNAQNACHAVIDSRLLSALFLALRGADTRCRNKAGKTPLDIASNLPPPSTELLGFYATKWLRACSQAPTKGHPSHSYNWSTNFLVCGSCGREVTRCLSCNAVVTVNGGSGTHASSTSNKEKITNAEPTLAPENNGIKVIPTTAPQHGDKIYTMNRNPRGKCIVINNINFHDPSHERKGSEYDAQGMKSLFTQLHFDVTEQQNLSVNDMVLTFNNAAKVQKAETSDCLVVILMSHGANGVIWGIDGKTLPLWEGAYTWFNDVNCPALKGKPKLFFIQACRAGAPPKAPHLSIIEAANDRISPWSDMFFAYATVPYYVAYRHTKLGSPFVSAICRVFSQLAATTHLDDLMKEVEATLSQHFATKGHLQNTNVDQYGWKKWLFFNPGYTV